MTTYLLKKWNANPAIIPPALLGVLILLTLVLLIIQWIVGGGASTNGDGSGYVYAWEESLRYLRPHSWRTPVYPIIIGCFSEWLPMEVVLKILLIINYLAYLLTVAILWNINYTIGVRRAFNIAASLLFYLIPALWIMNELTQPEVLCGLGVAALIWETVKLLKSPSTKWIWLVTLTIGYLIFTKPAFVCFLAFYIVLIGWLAYRNRRYIKTITLASLLLFGSIAFYQWQMYRFYQVTAMSLAQPFNGYVMLRQDGLITPDDIEADSVRARFLPLYEKDRGERHAEGWTYYLDELMAFTSPEKWEMTNAAIKKHPIGVAKGAAYRFVEAAQDGWLYYQTGDDLKGVKEWVMYTPGKNPFFYPLIDILNFPLGVSWIVFLIFSAIIISKFVGQLRERKASDTIAGISLAIKTGLIISALYLLLTVTSVVGAQNDWGRLVWPVSLLVPGMSVYSLQTVWRHK